MRWWDCCGWFRNACRMSGNEVGKTRGRGGGGRVTMCVCVCRERGGCVDGGGGVGGGEREVCRRRGRGLVLSGERISRILAAGCGLDSCGSKRAQTEGKEPKLAARARPGWGRGRTPALGDVNPPLRCTLGQAACIRERVRRECDETESSRHSSPALSWLHPAR